MFSSPCLKFAVAIGLLVFSVARADAQSAAVDPQVLESLKTLIEAQQQQLQRQAETIEALKQRVEGLERTTTEVRDTAVAAKSAADEVQQAVEAGGVGDPTISSGQEKVKLSIYGQVNRALNVADDGNATDVYFVDNDTSNSRVGFSGTAKVDGTTIGSVLEIGFSANNSYNVSQDSERASDDVSVRKADVYIRNDDYGKLSFGKGSAAGDDTAEYDLSLVAGPIMYSGVADIVGGLKFTQNGALTSTTVGDAFFNFDSNRQDRVRYDTVNFGPGIQGSVSAGSDERYDIALTWGGDYGDWTGVDYGNFTTLGAISLADPNSSGVDYRVAGSFSVLHNPSGISATFSGGMDERNDNREPFNLYGKLAMDKDYFSIGATGFGVDLTYSEDIAALGDEGFSAGLAIVQLYEEFGAEFYAQLRMFDLDRQGNSDLEGIYVGTVGTRVKF
ncbi:hypothetical protein NUH88_03135 [Nisaea acidiphila]|uniref:Porin n=1 Tax=Nisaea acidiphila TaxID=1862145 RepID=A0A9J7AW73_9PROT|nr:hypothetical protein [Nisaea acidiphila]UUX50697.1 hypothetical protein NUH88_03135 [Nisaea acidiphila]